jgi:elongation factor 1-beta
MATTAVKKADVTKKATELEGKLKGKLFLGEGEKSSSHPTAADVKAFNDLLGAGNLHLFRWVKHMASFSDAERKAWPATAPKATKCVKTAECGKVDAKPAAEPANKGTSPAVKPGQSPATKPAGKPGKAPKADDDELDLFGEETEEEKAALAAKKTADEEKKKAKPAVIAKSSILMDIKPWDDTTDLNELATLLKQVQREGLVWGAHKLVDVAYGIKKLQQLIVIEDEKVSGDDLEDIITGFTDHVQSIDIVAWNKV